MTIGGTVSLAVVLVCESDRWASTQSFVPPDMLGRYIAASRLVSWGMTPIAALAAGAPAQTVGLRAAFGIFAALCLAMAYPLLRVITAEAIAAVDVSPAPEPASGRASGPASGPTPEPAPAR